MMLTGENGILTRAGQAKEETESQSDLEVVKLAVTTGVTDNLVNQAEINTAIQDELRKSDNASTVTGEGSEKTIKYKEKMYIVNIKTRKIEQTTEEKLAQRAIKIKINTGENGVVKLPVLDTENSTIDWGDGTTNSNTDLGKVKNKIASNGKLKIATSGNQQCYEHTYSEKNKEYVVSITGDVSALGSMEYSRDKIIEIVQWGETGLEFVDFSCCSNLKRIAKPSENSFKLITDFYLTFCECTSLESIPEGLFDNCPNVTSFEGTLSGCTSLESIPEGLFDNCPNVTSFVGTFSQCTKLSGKAPELWKRGNNSQENEYEGNPYGNGCFKDCNNLNNYNEIPDFWKTAGK